MQAPPAIPPNRLPLATLIQHLIYESHTKLTLLSSQVQSLSPNDRKQVIYNYIHQTHERFIRLLVLIRWVKQHKKNFAQFDQFISSMIGSSSALQFAANSLYNVDMMIKGIRAPVFDLPTAIDVLTTGTYDRLPFAIEEAGSSNLKEERNAVENQEKALNRLNDLIRMKLLQSTIPDKLIVTEIDNGQVILTVPNEFIIILTLKYDYQYYQQLTNQTEESLQLEKEKKNAYIWRILHLQFFVNEVGVTVSPLSFESVHRLRNILQLRLDQRMTEEPLQDVYDRLHAVSMRLVVDILSKQSNRLQLYKWQNCSILCDTFNEHVGGEISFLIKYMRNHPNMKSILLSRNKMSSALEQNDTLTYDSRNLYAGELRFFVSQEKRLMIEHQCMVSGRDMKSNYSLNYSKMDLSEIVHSAIQKHISHLLGRIRDFIQRSNSSKLTLRMESYSNSDTVLIIHMFETYHIHMTIDWRSGKFVLVLKKGKYSVSFDLQDIQDHINLHDELKTKQLFGDMLIQLLEKARQRVIIYSYAQAAKLLGLDTFHFLPGLNRERELRSQMLFIRYPNYSDVYISIKANNTIHKKGREVSCRIIFQVSPRLIERKIGDITPDLAMNGYGTDKRQNGYHRHLNGSDVQSHGTSATTLVAFKHLKKIVEAYKNNVGKHLIVEQLESKYGINFQII